jgi:hypothetical protein
MEGSRFVNDAGRSGETLAKTPDGGTAQIPPSVLSPMTKEDVDARHKAGHADEWPRSLRQSSNLNETLSLAR